MSFFRFIERRRVSGRDSVAIRNGGGGTLTELRVTAIEWKGAERWLDAVVRPTTAPAMLHLALNARGLELPVGRYVAVVLVASPVAVNGPVAVRVTYEVRR